MLESGTESGRARMIELVRTTLIKRAERVSVVQKPLFHALEKNGKDREFLRNQEPRLYMLQPTSISISGWRARNHASRAPMKISRYTLLPPW